MPRSPDFRLVVAACVVGAILAMPTGSPAQGGQPGGQDAAPGARDTTSKGGKAKAPKVPTRFFDASEPIPLTFTANLRQLRRDKGEKAPWRAATLSYVSEAGDTVRVPLRVRTRGIWRLRNCNFPPVRLDFAGNQVTHTVFEGLDKPKLVNYCRDNDRSEQYVLQEFQLYRVYGLLTPLSHKVRLARITYLDSASAERLTTRYAVIVEEPQALAERVGGELVREKGAGPGFVDPYYSALVGVFQYLIGNTDWSISVLHNAEVVRDSAYVFAPIAFDFDFAGAVDASYASPDPKLAIKDVRERVYRGYCVPEEQYARVFALFNEKKDAIYALYHDQLGGLLEPRVVKQTLEYFDEFYRTINDRRSARRQIIEACVGGP
jgi:hypothetical protein